MKYGVVGDEYRGPGLKLLGVSIETAKRGRLRLYKGFPATALARLKGPRVAKSTVSQATGIRLNTRRSRLSRYLVSKAGRKRESLALQWT